MKNNIVIAARRREHTERGFRWETAFHIAVEAADASQQCAEYIVRRLAHMADLLGYAKAE